MPHYPVQSRTGAPVGSTLVELRQLPANSPCVMAVVDPSRPGVASWRGAFRQIGQVSRVTESFQEDLMNDWVGRSLTLGSKYPQRLFTDLYGWHVSKVEKRYQLLPFGR